MVKRGRDVCPGDSIQFMGRFAVVSEVLEVKRADYIVLRINQSTYARIVGFDEKLTVNAPFEIKVGGVYRTSSGYAVEIVEYVDNLGFIGTRGDRRIVYNANGVGAEDNIVELHSAPVEPYSISTYQSSVGVVVRATCNQTGLYAESHDKRSLHANRAAAIEALGAKLGTLPDDALLRHLNP